MRSLWLVLLFALVACTAAPAQPVEPTVAPTEEVAAPTDKVASLCLVTDTGNIGDGTYNELAYEGMVEVARDFDLLDHFVETISESDQAANIEECVEGGYDVIITLGPLIAPASHAVAVANPDRYFIGIDYIFDQPPPPNMSVIQYREDQAGFLAGALACMMTESDTVGGVYGLDFPALRRFRNGFENGCHYVNPDATTLGAYMESFTDPAAGSAQAEAFIAEGADVIFGAAGPTGSGAILTAAADGVWVIGVDQDEYLTTFANGDVPGSERVLSSAVKRVDAGVYQQVQALVEPGSFPWSGGDFYTLGVSNDGIAYADFHEAETAIPEEVKERLEEIRQQLADESLQTGVEYATGDPLPDQIPDPVPFEPATGQ